MSNKFSNRLKILRIKYGYTQKELSKIIGIKQTTISNYEKGLRFPDAYKLKQIANLFNVSVDYLLGQDDSILIRESVKSNLINKEDYKFFLDYLLQGKKEEARQLILDICNMGATIDDIYFNILEKTLIETGYFWEKGKVDVWKEHYVSENILDIMRDVGSFYEKEKNIEKSVIALTAGGELHNIGIKMISDLLELEGYKVTYLGSNVPVLSLINAIESENAKVIAISVTMEYNIESSKNIIEAIRNKFRDKAPTIIIGGRAFLNIKDVCSVTGADYYCKNINDIRAVII